MILDHPVLYRWSALLRKKCFFILTGLAGGNAHEEIPVPIPNTEVKLMKADGTDWETDRESRKLPAIFFTIIRRII